MGVAVAVSQTLEGLVEGLPVASEDHYGRAFPDELLGDGTADAAVAARDDCDLVLELHGRISS